LELLWDWPYDRYRSSNVENYLLYSIRSSRLLSNDRYIMYETDSINLLRTKTGISPKLTAIGKELKVVSIILSTTVVVFGLLTAVAYFILNKNYQEHVGVKKQMEASIVSESKKEGLYISIQDRLRSIENILIQAFPWDSAFTTILTLALPNQIKSLTIDDTQQVSMRIDTATFEDARDVIEKIVTYIQQSRIIKPNLTRLQLDPEGNIRMSLSFQFNAKP